MVIQVDSKSRFKELVLLFEARKIPYSFEKEKGAWILIIPDYDSARAATEIYLYRKENINWPPSYPKIKETSFFTKIVNGSVIFALILFHLKISLSGDNYWLNQGKASSEKILSGEWQRTITALTLHADASHLLGNCAVLFIAISGLSSFISFGRTWFYIVLSGGAGNFISAYIYKINHNSIGSSSAVFGALGILGGVHILVYRGTIVSIIRRLIPLFSAIALLGLLGTAPGSDLLGHMFGFISGLAIGMTLIFIKNKNFQENRYIELLLLCITMIFIYTCWKNQLVR